MFILNKWFQIPYFNSIILTWTYKLVSIFWCEMNTANILIVTFKKGNALYFLLFFRWWVVTPQPDFVIFCSWKNPSLALISLWVDKFIQWYYYVVMPWIKFTVSILQIYEFDGFTVWNKYSLFVLINKFNINNFIEEQTMRFK